MCSSSVCEAQTVKFFGILHFCYLHINFIYLNSTGFHLFLTSSCCQSEYSSIDTVILHSDQVAHISKK